MAEWSSGYVVDIGYTHGFYRELTPSYLSFLGLLQGFQVPGQGIDSLAYCELGCGQGFSTNLLAAANPHIQFHATDFNPGHIAGARELARSAGLKNVHFSDDSFAEFGDRDDLPEFDFISLHGIYSWISTENRKAIVAFIRRKLKPGGVVYLSYNAMPGWASVMPLRRMLLEHAAAQGSKPLASRIANSLEFATRLGGVDSRYFASHPKLASRLDRLKTKNSNYVAHEYFNKDWNPFYFMDVAQELSEAKLTWIGSAHTLDTIDEINLTAEQTRLLADIDDVVLRETVRDHIIDQQFRRDIFVKGPLALAKGCASERWLDTRFALSCMGSDIPRSVQGNRYKATFQADLYEPLIAALEHAPHTPRELMGDPVLARVGLGKIARAITFLVGQGVCQPSLQEEQLGARRAQTERFNLAVADQARHENKFSHFASPATGGGIAVDRVRQLIWLGSSRREENVPQFIWNTLSQGGHRLVKGGKTLTTEAENLEELRLRVSQYEGPLKPVWDNLGLSARCPDRPSVLEDRRLQA